MRLEGSDCADANVGANSNSVRSAASDNFKFCLHMWSDRLVGMGLLDQPIAPIVSSSSNGCQDKKFVRPQEQNSHCKRLNRT